MLRTLDDGPVKRRSEIRRRPMDGSSVKDEVRKGSRDVDVAAHGLERKALDLVEGDNPGRHSD
jgi:hypothetical protein